MPSGGGSRTLQEWLALQEAAHPQTIDLGLERVSAVARTLGVERAAAPVITVAGTNGKGSTAAHLEAFLHAAGIATGLFTSPHFLKYNERIRVAGVDVTDAELVAAFEEIERARGATSLTFFEYNTLAALLVFARRSVGAVVLEVGLGGRLDATNLIDADVGVVTSIGFDHRDWLGDTLELIGAEKAGIFRPQRPAVLGTSEMPATVYAAIARLGARAVVAGREFSWTVAPEGSWSYRGSSASFAGLPPSALAGSIQYRNAATALAAIEALGARAPELTGAVIARGLSRVRLAGRFQIVPGPPEWILDIAHNEPAARLFASQVSERPMPGRDAAPEAKAAPGRTLAVIGVLRDKDALEIVGALKAVVQHWIVCTLPGARGQTAAALAARAQLGEAVTLADSVEQGCERARAMAERRDRVLVFGSVYTVGPALRWLGLE